jgi:hypothetical protein
MITTCEGHCEDCGVHFELTYFTYPPMIRCRDCADILYLLNSMEW